MVTHMARSFAAILWTIYLGSKNISKVYLGMVYISTVISWHPGLNTWFFPYTSVFLTHWGRVTHICVSNLTIIGSDNGLSPGRRQAIIWTNAGILLIGPLGTNFSEIIIGIQTFSFQKMHLKMSSANGRLFSLGLNELTNLVCNNSEWMSFSSQLSWCNWQHEN